MTLRQTRLRSEPHDLGSLRLYREDLVAIATAVAEIGELRIQASEQPVANRRGSYEFEATSPEDFSGMPDQLAEVVIAARRTSPPGGGISVTLSRSRARADLVGPDTLMSGVLVRITQICELRRRRLRSLRSSSETSTLPVIVSPVIVAVVLLLIAILSGGTGGTLKWSSSDTIITAVGGTLALATAGWPLLASRPLVKIINAPIAERPTYWRRTRDSWTIGIVTAVFGTVLGFILGKIT